MTTKLPPVWEIDPGPEKPLLSSERDGDRRRRIRAASRSRAPSTRRVGRDRRSRRLLRSDQYLHNLLQGRADPELLHAAEMLWAHHATLAPQADWSARRVAPGDVVVLHDPQTRGLVAAITAGVGSCGTDTSAPTSSQNAVPARSPLPALFLDFRPCPGEKALIAAREMGYGRWSCVAPKCPASPSRGAAGLRPDAAQGRDDCGVASHTKHRRP